VSTQDLLLQAANLGDARRELINHLPECSKIIVLGSWKMQQSFDVQACQQLRVSEASL
jgi:hypothetical protein